MSSSSRNFLDLIYKCLPNPLQKCRPRRSTRAGRTSPQTTRRPRGRRRRYALSPKHMCALLGRTCTTVSTTPAQLRHKNPSRLQATFTFLIIDCLTTLGSRNISTMEKRTSLCAGREQADRLLPFPKKYSAPAHTHVCWDRHFSVLLQRLRNRWHNYGTTLAQHTTQHNSAHARLHVS
jgi:hypothetical protein